MLEEPTQNAAEELAIWELAMKTLHAAERQLEAARRTRNGHPTGALLAKVEAMRHRADLLLARAVQAMRNGSSEVSDDAASVRTADLTGGVALNDLHHLDQKTDSQATERT